MNNRNLLSGAQVLLERHDKFNRLLADIAAITRAESGKIQELRQALLSESGSYPGDQSVSWAKAAALAGWTVDEMLEYIARVRRKP